MKEGLYVDSRAHTSSRWTKDPRATDVADLACMRRILGAACESELRDRSNRREGLTAKAMGCNLLEVLHGLNFARGMPSHGQAEIDLRDAAAVVLDPDAPNAAIFEGQVDLLGASVDRIFEQLFDHRGRTLDDLAGCDLADEEVWKQADGGHRLTSSVTWPTADSGQSRP